MKDNKLLKSDGDLSDKGKLFVYRDFKNNVSLFELCSSDNIKDHSWLFHDQAYLDFEPAGHSDLDKIDRCMTLLRGIGLSSIISGGNLDKRSVVYWYLLSNGICIDIDSGIELIDKLINDYKC